MEQFYCIYCQDLCTIKQSARVFQTGFIRVNQQDYPMGICQDHAPDDKDTETLTTP